MPCIIVNNRLQFAGLAVVNVKHFVTPLGNAYFAFSGKEFFTSLSGGRRSRQVLCQLNISECLRVTDTVDLSDLKWARGGYEKSELTNLYSLNREVAVKRANHIIESLDKYVTSVDTVKGLGFCVSKERAHFMAEQFNAAGIASISLVGESKDEERKTAKDRLVKGELRFIFVVDIYNEGVDIPEVNTVLFLRPTESLTRMCRMNFV